MEDLSSYGSGHVRLNLTIPPELDSYLEQIGTVARAAGGYKVPKTAILRALVRAYREMNVDVTGGVRTEEDMLERILKAAAAYKGKSDSSK
mgnify:CR=1 FL=1